ncbi:cysteine hydrolase [Hoeflea sp. WL0058]|uniref:Cysteine hydrolase n=1 Tax=Flavimaribacter sediminis TaxID=2865987 RepID=A0AAE2ZM79_9HYPH|nr:isochorismatase family cysteine hydrolase [Flavimaribacter sediminis]MBW8637351.1 cysteine hydrolase [Flavimaribacter sediminis]
MSRIAADLPADEIFVRPALLIVDMQNDFVREGAPLEVPDARKTVASIARLAERFRRIGAPVVYTRFLARKEDNLLWLWSPQCHAEIRCCWRGTRREYADTDQALECTDVIDELRPQKDEPIIDKYGYGSFHGTNLDELLRSLGVQSIILTGTVTQICVEETGREAFHHGYRTTIVADGVSSFAPDLQAATLKNFAMKFGWVSDTASILDALETVQPEAGTLS